VKDSIRITKTKRGGVRIRATGRAADKLFRVLAGATDGFCRKTGGPSCGERECSLGCNWSGVGGKPALGEEKKP
jgi:hypothetical protein